MPRASPQPGWLSSFQDEVPVALARRFLAYLTAATLVLAVLGAGLYLLAWILTPGR